MKRLECSSLEGRKGWHDSSLQRATHTPMVTVGDSSIAQTEASGHALIARPGYPLQDPDTLILGTPALCGLYSPPEIP